jgi:hypothetical protein
MIFLFSFLVSKVWPILPIYLEFLHKKTKFYKKKEEKEFIVNKVTSWGLRQANLGPMTQVDPRCSNSTWIGTSGLGTKTGCPGAMTKIDPWVPGSKSGCLEDPLASLGPRTSGLLPWKMILDLLIRWSVF